MTAQHQTILDYAAAIGRLDADGFVACFTADCQLNDPVGAPPALGHAGARAFFGAFAPLLASISFTPGQIHHNGLAAAFTWTIEAVGKGGQTATANGIDVMEFDATGKIAKSFGYWNPGPFVAALTA